MFCVFIPKKVRKEEQYETDIQSLCCRAGSCDGGGDFSCLQRPSAGRKNDCNILGLGGRRGGGDRIAADRMVQ